MSWVVLDPNFWRAGPTVVTEPRLTRWFFWGKPDGKVDLEGLGTEVLQRGWGEAPVGSLGTSESVSIVFYQKFNVSWNYVLFYTLDHLTTNRVVNTWNSLPNWVVSAYTTDTFKARLDKFWHSQDIVYDFRAQLQGTGSHSEVLCEKFE